MSKHVNLWRIQNAESNERVIIYDTDKKNKVINPVEFTKSGNLYHIVRIDEIDENEPQQEENVLEVTDVISPTSEIPQYAAMHHEQIMAKLEEAREDRIKILQEVINDKIEIINTIEEESARIRQHSTEKINELQQYIDRFSPHKRVFGLSIFFICFFGFSILVRLFLDIYIVNRFWDVTGLLISFFFFSLSFGLEYDRNRKNNG